MWVILVICHTMELRSIHPHTSTWAFHDMVSLEEIILCSNYLLSQVYRNPRQYPFLLPPSSGIRCFLLIGTWGVHSCGLWVPEDWVEIWCCAGRGESTAICVLGTSSLVW